MSSRQRTLTLSAPPREKPCGCQAINAKSGCLLAGQVYTVAFGEHT